MTLINRQAVRRYILDTWKRKRPHRDLSQVSSEAYEDIEAALRSKINQMIDRHPSVGKTFKP
jgi:hypothetical protein